MIEPSEKMFVQEADYLLARFAAERLQYSTEGFRSRFISYVYLNQSRKSVEPFLRAASTMAGINIKIHLFFRNPIKYGESFLLLIILSVITLGVFSLLNDQAALGITLICGAVVQTAAIVRKSFNDYFENELQMYIYQELKQIIDEELESISGAPPGQ